MTSRGLVLALAAVLGSTMFSGCPQPATEVELCSAADDCVSGACISGVCSPWVQTFGSALDGNANQTDVGLSVVFDDEGGYFVAMLLSAKLMLPEESVDVGADGASMVILHFSPQHRVDGTGTYPIGHRPDLPMFLAWDGVNGHLLLAGSYFERLDLGDLGHCHLPDTRPVGGTDPRSDAFVARLGKNLKCISAEAFGDPLAEDRVMSLAVDAAGNAVIAGYFQSAKITLGANSKSPQVVLENETTPTEELFVAKYDVDGNVVFATSLGGKHIDRADGIAILKNGDVIVTGSYDGDPDNMIPSGCGDVLLPNTGSPNPWGFLFRMNGIDGTCIWHKEFASEQGGLNRGVDVVVDGDDNIVLLVEYDWTKMTISAKTPPDVSVKLPVETPARYNGAIIKFDDDGNYLSWAQRLALDPEADMVDTSDVGDQERGSLAVNRSNGDIVVTSVFASKMASLGFPDQGDASTILPNGAANNPETADINSFRDIFIAKFKANGDLAFPTKTGKSIGGQYPDALLGDLDVAISPKNGNVILVGSFTKEAQFGGILSEEVKSVGYPSEDQDVFILRLGTMP